MTSSRHIPADADLTYFTVTCHLAPIVADLSQDSDYDPNTARIDAIVTFTPKYKAGEVIHSHTSTPPTGFLALPVTALIDDGYLKLRAKPDAGAAPLPGTLHGLKAKIAADTGQEMPVTTDVRAALNYAPVRLLGNSTTLEIDPEIPLYYDFTFTNIKIDGKQTNYVITGGTFEAPWEDTVIDLLDFMPLSPGPYAQPMVVGPQGPQGEPGPATVNAGTTTTSLPGSDAQVSNAGDGVNAVFDFVIPRGDVGPVGPAGGLLEFDSVAAFPAAGTTGQVYLAKDTGDTYRWDADAKALTYVRISERVPSTGIEDSTAVGRAVVVAADGKAGRLALNAGPAFSVRDFAAKGDGTTDDTAAIQACIDAAAAEGLAIDTQNRRFVTVDFPPGLYRSRNLTVPACVVLKGNSATIRAVAGTTGYLVTFTDGYFGGMHQMRIMAANQTDDLGGVHTTSLRRGIVIDDCSIENFRGSAVYLEGGNPRLKGNYLFGLLGDQSALTTHRGVLEFAVTANDAVIVENEMNSGRWNPNLSMQTPPVASRSMFVCAVAVLGAGVGRFHSNIAECSETGWFFKNCLQIHMSGDRGEFNWGHGFVFVGGSGRLDGCASFENSKVESGKFDGFHWGDGDVADLSDYQVSNSVSRSNIGTYGDFAQHRFGVFDNSVNNVYGNSFDNFRSYGDVAWFSAAPATYGGGPQYAIPSANSAFVLSGATPSVRNKTWFRCTNATAATITEFAGSVPGQMFYVLGNGVTAVENNTKVTTLTGAATTLANNKVYTFVNHDGVVRQVDLSANHLTGKTIIGGRYDNFLTTLGLPGIVLDAPVASVSSLRVSPGVTGGPVVLKADSTEASASFRLWPKGNGQVTIYSDATFTPTIYATGADANHSLRLSTKGTGTVQANGVQVETKGHKHVAADVTGALSWTATVPGQPSAAGTQGQLAADGQFLYVCVTSGAAGAAVWKRLAFEVWV